MGKKKNNWAYNIGYNLGGSAFILGVFFGAAFLNLSLWYSLSIRGNLITTVMLLGNAIVGFILFGIGYIFVSKNNFWLDEGKIKKEILAELEDEKVNKPINSR